MKNRFNVIKLCYGAAYIYLVLPFIIFVLGWCRWYVSVPIFFIVGFSLYSAIQLHQEKKGIVQLDRSQFLSLIAVFFLIVFWVYLSGIGQFVWQNEDHYYRNTIFKVLIEYDWPVTSNRGVFLQDHDSVLIYYIGFWLPAAIIGKAFGESVGVAALFLWAVFGIYIMYLLLCIRRKKISIWPILIIIIFSGLDIVGGLIWPSTSISLLSVEHLERWIGRYQFSSMTTQLFWVFNQAIPSWIAAMLVFSDEKKQNIIFVWAAVMLNATLPFIGFLPYILYYALKDSAFIIDKKLFSIQNVLGGGCIGIISFLYLAGNGSGGKTGAAGSSILGTIPHLIVFWILEIGVYLVFAYRGTGEKKLFWLTFLWLLVIPNIYVGSSIDFCMRASIPGLFLVMLWCIDALGQYKSRIMFWGLIICLSVGSITALHEIGRTIKYSSTDFEIVYVDESAVMTEDNFSGERTGIFWEYIAK